MKNTLLSNSFGTRKVLQSRKFFMQNMVRNLTWPDFEVSVDGSMIILKRVKERYFPRKTKAESSQLNDESSKQE